MMLGITYKSHGMLDNPCKTSPASARLPLFTDKLQKNVSGLIKVPAYGPQGRRMRRVEFQAPAVAQNSEKKLWAMICTLKEIISAHYDQKNMTLEFLRGALKQVLAQYTMTSEEIKMLGVFMQTKLRTVDPSMVSQLSSEHLNFLNSIRGLDSAQPLSEAGIKNIIANVQNLKPHVVETNHFGLILIVLGAMLRDQSIELRFLLVSAGCYVVYEALIPVKI